MRRALFTFLVGTIVLVVGAGPAFACGGLLAPNGTVNLLRTATFAGYHAGVEHYVTSFEFAGEAKNFGSIIPLPGVPSKVIKGGDWTLQRLEIETQPQPEFAANDAAGAALSAEPKAKVLLETTIDALDVTILSGGGDSVGEWAEDNGFNLPPDAPEVLDFYAARSPIFMAAKFDADAALERGQLTGDGTPVHLVIPTQDPWVPLRILGLGKKANEVIEADVYLLTDAALSMLPRPKPAGFKGMSLEVSAPASELLLSDLRSDRGMKWLPSTGMWLSYLAIEAKAGDLQHDLALDATGLRDPSPIAAGLVPPGASKGGGTDTSTGAPGWLWVVAFGAAIGVVALAGRIAPR